MVAERDLEPGGRGVDGVGIQGHGANTHLSVVCWEGAKAGSWPVLTPCCSAARGVPMAWPSRAADPRSLSRTKLAPRDSYTSRQVAVTHP